MIKLEIKFDNEEVKKRIKFEKAYPDDCGFDLYNASNKTIIVYPDKAVEIPAGISVSIPTGYCGFIRPRSSTFFKRGLLVVNGVIDSGFTGPLFSFVWNPRFKTEAPIHIEPWERLAQLVILAIPEIEVVEVEELTAGLRGTKGFGSSGK